MASLTKPSLCQCLDVSDDVYRCACIKYATSGQPFLVGQTRALETEASQVGNTPYSVPQKRNFNISTKLSITSDGVINLELPTLSPEIFLK